MNEVAHGLSSPPSSLAVGVEEEAPETSTPPLLSQTQNFQKENGEDDDADAGASGEAHEATRSVNYRSGGIANPHPQREQLQEGTLLDDASSSATGACDAAATTTGTGRGLGPAFVDHRRRVSPRPATTSISASADAPQRIHGFAQKSVRTLGGGKRRQHPLRTESSTATSATSSFTRRPRPRPSEEKGDPEHGNENETVNVENRLPNDSQSPTTAKDARAVEVVPENTKKKRESDKGRGGVNVALRKMMGNGRIVASNSHRVTLHRLRLLRDRDEEWRREWRGIHLPPSKAPTVAAARRKQDRAKGVPKQLATATASAAKGTAETEKAKRQHHASGTPKKTAFVTHTSIAKQAFVRHAATPADVPPSPSPDWRSCFWSYLFSHDQPYVPLYPLLLVLFLYSLVIKPLLLRVAAPSSRKIRQTWRVWMHGRGGRPRFRVGQKELEAHIERLRRRNEHRKREERSKGTGGKDDRESGDGGGAEDHRGDGGEGNTGGYGDPGSGGGRNSGPNVGSGGHRGSEEPPRISGAGIRTNQQRSRNLGPRSQVSTETAATNCGHCTANDDELCHAYEQIDQLAAQAGTYADGNAMLMRRIAQLTAEHAAELQEARQQTSRLEEENALLKEKVAELEEENEEMDLEMDYLVKEMDENIKPDNLEGKELEFTAADGVSSALWKGSLTVDDDNDADNEDDVHDKDDGTDTICRENNRLRSQLADLRAQYASLRSRLEGESVFKALTTPLRGNIGGRSIAAPSSSLDDGGRGMTPDESFEDLTSSSHHLVIPGVVRCAEKNGLEKLASELQDANKSLKERLCEKEGALERLTSVIGATKEEAEQAAAELKKASMLHREQVAALERNISQLKDTSNETEKQLRDSLEKKLKPSSKFAEEQRTAAMKLAKETELHNTLTQSEKEAVLDELRVRGAGAEIEEEKSLAKRKLLEAKNTLGSRAADLKSQLKEEQLKTAAGLAKVTVSDSKTAQLKENIASLQNKDKEMEEQLRGIAAAASDEAKPSLAEAKDHVTSLESKFKTERLAAASKLAEVIQLHNESAAAERTVAVRANNFVAQLEEQITSVQNPKRDKELESEDVKSKITAMEEKILSVEQLAAQKLERQMEIFEAVAARLTKETKASDKRIMELHSNLSKLTTKTEKQAALLEAAMQSIQTTEDAKNDLQTKYDSVSKVESELRRDVSKLESTATQQANEKEKLILKFERAEVDIGRLKTEKDEVFSMLYVLQNRIVNLKSNIAATKDQTSSTISELSEQVATLENKLEAENQSNTQLSAQVASSSKNRAIGKERKQCIDKLELVTKVGKKFACAGLKLTKDLDTSHDTIRRLQFDATKRSRNEETLTNNTLSCPRSEINGLIYDVNERDKCSFFDEVASFLTPKMPNESSPAATKQNTPFQENKTIHSLLEYAIQKRSMAKAADIDPEMSHLIKQLLSEAAPSNCDESNDSTVEVSSLKKSRRPSLRHLLSGTDFGKRNLRKD